MPLIGVKKAVDVKERERNLFAAPHEKRHRVGGVRMSLWQLAKDKKRRVAQKLAERRASIRSNGDGEDAEDPYYKPAPELLEERARFKDYVKASKLIQKKVAVLASRRKRSQLLSRTWPRPWTSSRAESSSRGDAWLVGVDRFHEAMQVKVESASAACLEALRAEHNVGRKPSRHQETEGP